MSSVRSSVVVLVFLLLGSMPLWSQNQNINIRPKENSPYSRYGLGNFATRNLVASGSMGGLTAAYNDPFHLNLLNPASLSHLRATAFEVGFYGKYTSLESPSQQDGLWGGNLGYLALGFPLVNAVNEALDQRRSPWDFGMSFSLQPYTQVGYDITTNIFNEDFIVATNYLKGDGGTYRLQWGNALQYKGLSFGVNLGYNFGKITNSRRVTFDSLGNAFDTEYLDEISVRGLTWNAGVQYVIDLKKTNAQGVAEASGKRLIIGAYGNSAQSINTNSSRFYQRNNVFNYSQALIDTLVFESDIRNDLRLPAEFTFGLAFENANKLKIGLEYGFGNWSDYDNPAKPESFSNSWRFAAGLEYIPDALSYNNYFKRTFYRAGFFHGTDPRTFGGEALKHTGFTLGVGLPIIMPRQQISFFDVSIEVGRFGLKEVLLENYVRFAIGFTLNDNSWFFKRKFN